MVFIFATMVLSFLFPYIAFPMTYVLGIIGSVLMLSYISISYGLKISKCFKRYATADLVCYKLSTYMAGYMWFVLAFIIVATAITSTATIGPFTTELLLFILFMYCVYLESEIDISDKSVFPIKTKLNKG